MFKNQREIFSIRKLKDGRADSVKIGAIALLMGTSMALSSHLAVQAQEVSSTSGEVPLVTNTDKVTSDKSTTFVDNDKKVNVDGVLDKDVAEPTKANNNTGEKDGTDTLNISGEAEVNYLLEDDKSKLKDSTKVETGTGTISTDYDKKGLASDTDGKDYRNSTVNKDNITVNSNTGKEDVISSNGKNYKLTRSEVSNEDKLKYDKTNFNDIEAKVSPEGLHDKFGEIDYTKLSKKKVYLVEETSDGHYGKFVVANNISNDNEAVEAWRNGQDGAKDFTKENVTLEEGDSILVLDKDTYAITKSTVAKKVKKGIQTYELELPKTVTKEKDGKDYNTYTIVDYTWGTELNSYRKPGSDGIFGTTDDVVMKPSSDPTYALLGFSGTYDNPLVFNADTNEEYTIGNLDVAHASLHDALHNFANANYKALDFLESKATNPDDVAKIQAARTRLDNHLQKFENEIKAGNVDVGILETGANKGRFVTNDDVTYGNPNYWNNAEKLRDALGNLSSIIGDLKVNSVNTEYKTEESFGRKVDKTIVTTKTYHYSTLGPHANITLTEEISTTENPIEKRRPYIPLVSDEPETTEPSDTIVRKGSITINSNGTVSITAPSEVDDDVNTAYTGSDKDGWKLINTWGERTQTTTTNKTEYTPKEVITPIRAYNVVSDGYATVNHYYTLKTEPEELKETIETKGKAIVKYIDANGNEIKSDETITPETVIKTVKKYETKSGITVVSTREDVINNDTPYDANKAKQDLIEKDGKKYKFSKVLETSDKYNNTTELTGNLKDGTTTVIYQYDYLIPVDPNKPHDGSKTPPKPDDKIPNDPQNRSYKDLGLLKEVERQITYVYENGNKAGQEASTPVKQNARFTRTALINSRTGEVSYETGWTDKQIFNEVISPTIENYNMDKDKVPTLEVSHESENSSVVVKYTVANTTTVIEHDADKDKKGTVVVKYVDINGTVLKESVVKDKVTVATARTVIETGKDPVTTYTPTNEKYSVTKDDTITVDGLTFKLNRIVPVTPELNNSVEENGLVKEGTTTVIYEYKLIIPSNDIVNEIPEFNGGVNPIDPPIVEIPEYTGGVVPIDPPVVDVPEYKEPIKDEPKVEKPKEEPKVETPKVTETPKQDTTPKKALPKTSIVSNVFAGLSSLIGLAGLSLKNKKD